MFLDKLVVENRGEVIRKVDFKKGLNLILDQTSNLKTATGNNVGKTTMVRVINYCLGGKIEGIYRDKETSTDNEIVKNFLQSPNVKLRLLLKGTNNDNYEIVRSFESRPLINNKEKSDSEFKQELGMILFKLKSEKPSLRELIGKFLRIENHQLENVYKYLHPSMTDSKGAYERIYLYFFGFPEHKILDDKSKIKKSIQNTKTIRKGLSAYKKGTLSQIIRALDKDIKEIEKKIKDFKVSESVKDDLVSLKDIRGRISQLSIDISNLDAKIEFGEKTISTLEEAKTTIEARAVREIYEQAKIHIDQLHKNFEEMINFHNSMINNKIKFVGKSMSSLKQDRSLLWEQIVSFQKEETECLKKMSKKGALEDYQNYNNKLASLKEERGERNGILVEKNKVEKELKALERDLEKVNLEITTYQNQLDKELEDFNDSYRHISKKLYDKEFIFAYDSENDDGYEFYVDTMHGTVGSGKKKGEIMAFDLAYLKFLEDKRANMCRFQIHDRVEEIHINQLKSAFEIADGIDGQFIIPILAEKIQSLGRKHIEENTIISLSQDEKFFKLS